jgi:hypothetical protein
MHRLPIEKSSNNNPQYRTTACCANVGKGAPREAFCRVASLDQRYGSDWHSRTMDRGRASRTVLAVES